jgi:hypothetical protein
MKIMRQEVEPTTGYDPKTVGYMTISTALIHEAQSHTHIFRKRYFYVDCTHQIL